MKEEQQHDHSDAQLRAAESQVRGHAGQERLIWIIGAGWRTAGEKYTLAERNPLLSVGPNIEIE